MLGIIMIEIYKKSSAIRWITFVICFIPYLLSAQQVYNFTKGLGSCHC
ncbi:hypothetical protein ADIARSV_0480 [Arcticibacter svalbardensis MN12-7]|uniref:Uncharacterized protein n=1 Tax=Arcticibacter svalbardensis MN12-7 TaxID=1150600 RepID=R9H579_9SPHI|nr:hypothetical protein ADIARSV_0480 [Arcticibacter svalbardensis MN12-7]